jgi:uncharacterized Tic20 family protein
MVQWPLEVWESNASSSTFITKRVFRMLNIKCDLTFCHICYWTVKIIVKMECGLVNTQHTHICMLSTTQYDIWLTNSLKVSDVP